MKFLMASVLTLALFIGCNKIEGQLNITKDLKLINSKGESHLLRLGTYSADIKANTSTKITLRLNNDSDEKFIFKHSGNMPSNGSFSISSKISGQPVDLSGTVATQVTNSPTRDMTESCTYLEPVQVCTPNPQGGVTCSVQYRTVYGMKWIRYYDRQTQQHVNMSVMAANSTEESADFNGDIAYSERIVINETNCR